MSLTHITIFFSVIESLYENGYLHRDISVRNLLFNDEPQLVSKSGLRDGLLIDFDYAVPDDENRTKSTTHRTVSPLAYSNYCCMRSHAYNFTTSIFRRVPYRSCLLNFSWPALQYDTSITTSSNQHSSIYVLFVVYAPGRVGHYEKI